MRKEGTHRRLPALLLALSMLLSCAPAALAAETAAAMEAAKAKAEEILAACKGGASLESLADPDNGGGWRDSKCAGGASRGSG